MSNAAQAWAWKQTTGHSTRKSILVALADHADHTGRCWPGHDGIAEKVECDRRTVIRHIQQLEDDGFLTIAKRRNGKGRQISNLYELHITQVSDCHPGIPGDIENNHDRVTSASPLPSDTGDQHRVTSLREPGDTHDTPEGDTGVTGTIIGTVSEPSVESAGAAPATQNGHDDDRSELARQLLQAFNVENSSSFLPGAYLLKIMNCLISQPELSDADHLAVVAWSMRNPWWKETIPHPGVIWGNAAQYERQVQGWQQSDPNAPVTDDSEYDVPVRVMK